MADILYTYNDSVYANITNRCNCRCTFCIRSTRDGVGSADTLWHQKNPTAEEVVEAIRNYDFTGFNELVFCGYGEPTCALDVLLAAAKVAKEEKHLKTRLNTNGLGNKENKKDIVPELSGVIDTVSISLNAPDKKKYQEVTRPIFDDGYDEMIDFARKCKGKISDLRWTIVDVLPAEDIEACKKLAAEAGIALRIRHYT